VKIVLAGDTHGDFHHLRYLLGAAGREGADRIFVLGDFGYWEHMREGVEFLNALEKQAIHAGVSVYFLDGNHDKTSLILQKYADEPNAEGFLTVRGRIFYAPRGHRWTWGDKRFIALGGAYSVDKDWRLGKERAGKRKAGTLWFPEEEMTDEEMVEILGSPEKVNVMLAHDKPLWSQPDWGRKLLDECKPNQRRLQAAVTTFLPELFVHGHLHYRYESSMALDTHRYPVHITEVIGLDCNASSAEPGKPYDKRDSWLTYDTETGVVSQQE
jgi:predicted phosphodiesterase